MTWETVIGLEVHAQLLTASKIFSGASTQFGNEPNTQACLVDLGFPGVLPVLNESVVHMAIRLGLGIGGEIAPLSVFSRKNYFYPDLPKGYQISQFDLPVVKNGYLSILGDDGQYRKIHIVRAHLEEDAGKSLHEDFDGMSGIDLNRAGTPLIEIVSAPELCSAQEAVSYLKTLHTLVRYLEICDGNMQEGSFRCDANVSVRKKGDPKLGTRTELKNINSFRYVERAIEFEVERQISVLENGGTIKQETRLYDPAKNETRPLRSKEEANDYRYFPDPDLLPLNISKELIESIAKTLPELPEKKYARFLTEHQLSEYDARVLTSTKEIADYFETSLKQTTAPAKLVANWISTELMGSLNKHNVDIANSPISAITLATLLTRIQDETISGKIAKTLFEMLWQGESNVDALIEKHDLKQITDEAQIEKFIDELLEKSPQQLAEYRSGKERLFGYFVGQAMKISNGKIHPEKLNELLKKKLS